MVASYDYNDFMMGRYIYPYEFEEMKMNEEKYVKVKKEDLIKVHKDSCGDVKKVLEGLYPGEFDGEKIDYSKIELRTHNHGLYFCVYLYYNGECISCVDDIHVLADGWRVKDFEGKHTLLTIERT